MARYIRIHDQPQGRVLPLTEGRMLIGRAADCDVRLEAGRVSRHHAALRVAGDQVWVQDLGSRNGTFLNGKPLKTEVEWLKGDRLDVADIPFMLVESETLHQAAVPPVPPIFDERGTGSAVAELSFWDAERQLPDHIGHLFQTMVQAGALLGSPRNPDEILDPILDLVENALATDRVMLYLRDENGELAQSAVRVAGGSSDQTPVLSSTLARRVLDERTSFLIDDALQDSQLAQQQSIIDMRVRSALAVPLFAEEDVLGLLYADRADPTRRFDSDDLGVLTVLGNLIAMALNQARLRDLQREQERLQLEMNAARDVMNSILQPDLPAIDGCEVVHLLEPCDEVGGDFYDVHLQPDGRVGLVLGDVSGHGLGAAFLVALIVPALRMLLDDHDDPVDVMHHMNRHLFLATDFHKFASLFLAIYDPATGELNYVNAGHVPPFHLRGALAPGQLPPGGPPVGMLEDFEYSSGTLRLGEGEALVMITDGVTECLGPNDEMYGEERLLGCLQKSAGMPAVALRDCLRAALADFQCDVEPEDDVTLLVIRRQPAGQGGSA